MSGTQPRPGRALRGAVERLLVTTPLLEKEMLAVRHLVPEGGVCVDVGAAGATWTWLLARQVGPGGHVLAVEPRPGAHQRVRRLLRWAGVDNATVAAVALSDRPGQLRLSLARMPTMSYVHPGEDSGWRPPDRRTEPRQNVTVRAVALDELVAEQGLGRVDFLKIDVEGHEPAVLAGAASTLARHRPVVLCEIEEQHLARYGHQPDEVFARLAEAGYRMHRLEQGRLYPTPSWSAAEHNYLALPRDGRMRPGVWSVGHVRASCDARAP